MSRNAVSWEYSLQRLLLFHLASTIETTFLDVGLEEMWTQQKGSKIFMKQISTKKYKEATHQALQHPHDHYKKWRYDHLDHYLPPFHCLP